MRVTRRLLSLRRIEPDLVDYDAKGRKHILTDGCGRASPDLWPLFKHAFDSHAAGRAASTADGSWNATSHKGPAPLLNRQALKAALGMGSSWPPIPEGGSGGVSSSELGGSRSRNPAASSGSMLSGGTAGQHQYPGYGTAPVGGRPAAASCSARSCSVDDRRAAEVAAAQNTAWGLHNLPTCHGAAADFGQLPPIQVRMHVPLSPAAAAAARTHAGRTEAACPWPVLALCKGTLSPDSLLPAGTIVVPFSMVKAPFITDAAESSAVMFSAVGSCNSAAGGAGATARDTPGSTQPLVGTWMYLQNACSEPCPVVHLEINSFAKTITRNSTQNLNATTIALLSGGGVPEKYFKDLLDAAVLDYNEGLETPLATAVRAKASGYEVCEQRILAGYGQEPLAYEGAPRQWAGSGANYADLQMCYDLHK